MAKRKRATVIVWKGDLILLVQERGNGRFGLPGGGIERGEPSLIAAARELYEETRLKLSSICYVGDVDRPTNLHYVFEARAYGEVRLQRKEISTYKWWDGKETVPLHPHVKQALAIIPQWTHPTPGQGEE